MTYYDGCIHLIYMYCSEFNKKMDAQIDLKDRYDIYIYVLLRIQWI